jgi:outer membrane protein assembly factor BamB
MQKLQFRKIQLLLLTGFMIPCSLFAEIPQEDILWKFSSRGSFETLPALYQGNLYCGDSEGYLYSIDAASGKEIWHYKVKYPIHSTVAAKDNIVCVEAGNALYGFNAQTGKFLWKYVAQDDEPVISLGLTDYHNSSPLIEGNIAYFGDGWGHLNGVNIKTGKQVFQYTTKARKAIRSKPAIKDNHIYFGDWEGNIYSVSLKDRSEKWKYTMANVREYYGAVVSEMSIRDNLLYFGSQHDVFSPIDLRTGIPRWTYVDTFQTYLPSSPVFYKEDVITGSTINAFKIYRLHEGKIVWAANTQGIFFVKPILIDSVLIMNSSNFGGTGYLYFIDCENGEIINTIPLEEATPSSPLIVDEKLIIGRKDGLYAIRFNSYLQEKSGQTSIHH